jgi:hypothetical protein
MSNVLFGGTHPKTEDYLAIGKVSDFKNVEWIFYNRIFNTGEVGDWINFKLVGDGYLNSKINFWLAYNFEEKRFAKTKDSFYLKEKYSDLYNDLILFIESNKDCFNGERK